ncbi:MAG: rubrerythrin family protein [Candidatus Bathyarchaeota archaeon]|nr:MAG: rubrerythrin family protein [Candidatus Bathyarchaeota archaeon]
MNESSEKLKAAFAGESQANRKYLAFAKKAEADGYKQVARLFRAAAEAETVHAHNHLRIDGGIGSTSANLKEAISGETFEYTKMYPEYLEIANGEGNKQAAWSFDVANKVEEIHAGYFKSALKAMEAGERLADTDYYVCQVCGNTVEAEAPEKCPICNAPRAQFLKVD